MSVRLGREIKAERKRRGLTQAELGELFGVDQSTVARYERGAEPGNEVLPEIARFLAKPVDVLLTRVSTNRAYPISPIHVIGAVEAGVWKEALEWDEDERFDIWMPHDPRYPGLARYALEVRGPSMNERYPEGSIVTCVKLIDLGRQPQPGERVICYRRAASGQFEATVKEFRIDEKGRAWLWPRSNHPDHQTPIPLSPPPKDEEIWIDGLVIQSTRLE